MTPSSSAIRCEPGAVRDQVNRILKSKAFRQSSRRQRFLQFLVEEALAGRDERLKGYAIGLEVFDRPTTFDPVVDPVVRIEAARLRDKLREYYDREGKDDAIRIELPKGGYAPRFEFAASATSPSTRSEPGTGDAVSGSNVGGANDTAAPERAHSILRSVPLGLICAAAAILAVAALVAGHAWKRPQALPERPSIAVLPFDNIGADPRWNRFADGLTEDIITDLSHAKDLIVIARNSTDVYKGKPTDVRQIGRDLNVKYVLEGSIQAIGERIRVTAQLIEASSGGHVWSERYDRQAEDLFAVQNEVTDQIASTLVVYQGAVAEAERKVLRRKRPANLTAYETYLLGIEAKHRVTKESLAEAEALFHKALDIDPQFARAYCALATVQYYLIDLGFAPSVEDAVMKMFEAAEKAVALDPNDGLTHQVLGMAYGYQGKPEQSLAELQRAEALAPSDADLLLIVAWSFPALGESARAVELANRALKLNPRYPDWYNQGLSIIYFFGGQYDDAVKYRLLVREPLAVDYAFLAMAYAQLGRTGNAEAAAAKVRNLNPSWNAERYLSESGGYADREADVFIQSARRVGLPDCMSPAVLAEKTTFIRAKTCDSQRASATSVGQ